MNNNATNTQGLARSRSIRIAFALGLLGSASLAFPQADEAGEDDGDVFELSPFEVSGDSDQGYRATSTLAGTRIRTDLKDVGSAISVYTEQFLDDIGATDTGTLLQYATNSEVGGTQGTYSGASAGAGLDETSGLINPVSTNRIRGLSAAENTRDFFVSDIPWDSYNVDRIDVQRGPNSILFGLGKPAGIINATLAGASFENEGEVGLRFASYGSMRTNVSVNKVLVEDTLAVRFAALMDHQKFQQNHAFEDDERLYFTVRYDPKIGGDSSTTSLKFKYEDGKIDSNRPRNVTPGDNLSNWYLPNEVTDSNPWGGGAKWAPENTFVGWRESGDNPYYSGTGINAQQPYWYLDGVSGAQLGAMGGVVQVGAVNSDGTPRGPSDGILGRAFSEQVISVDNLSSVAGSYGFEFAEFGQHKTASLQDPTVFDFYNNLIDGPNKSEFADWDAYNLDFSQTWFNDKLGVQLIKDTQNFSRGGDSVLGWRPSLTMDIGQALSDLSPNPNFGRPFVSSSTAGSGESYSSERDYNRASVFAELDAKDFLDSDSFIAKLIGKHRFNGVYSEEDYKTENLSWMRATHDQTWAGYWNGNDGSSVSIGERPPVAIIYLGDSIADRNSAAGANIPGMQNMVDIYTASAYQFDSTWIGGTNYGDPWTPTTAYETTMYGTDPRTQASNEANYVGWTNRELGILRYDMGANPDLLRNASLAQRETESKAFTWQGFLLDGAVVPTLGFREDTVMSRGVTAKPVSANRSILDIGSAYTLPADYGDSTFTDSSRSRGVVVHLNKLLNDKLPMNVSLSYNESNNFEVTDVRRNLYGNPIDNPTGATEDIGLSLSTKDGKYSFRAIKYESEVLNGSTSLNVGRLGQTVQEGMKMRNVFLYDLAAYNWESRGNNLRRNTWGGQFDEFGDELPLGADPDTNQWEGAYFPDVQTEAEGRVFEDSAINTWNQIQADLTEKGFFEAWNMNVVPLQYLTDRSTIEATSTLQPADPSDPSSILVMTPEAKYVPADLSLVTSYSAVAPQNFTATADNVSKGYEFEFIANPTDNLRIALNASKTEAIANNVGGPLIDEFVDYMAGMIEGTPAGNLPRWGAARAAINPSIFQAFRSEYTRMKLQEGTANPELRKWRFNAIVNYSFNDGKFNGLGLGGSYRWQDKVGIGYPTIVDGASASFDINDPFWGPSESSLDLWASYKKKLTDKIDWKIQLNIRNAFASEGLIPISVQPDGKTIAGVKIAPNQEWFLSNTFSF